MKQKIGILDSGKGGLETLKYLRKEYKNIDFIFYGDYKNAPYGTKTKTQLFSILLAIIKKFEKKNIKYLLFACNTASTLIPLLKKHTHLKLLSVIDATIYYKNHFNFKHHNCLLFATKFTVEQNIYQQHFTNVTSLYNNKIIDDIQNNVQNYDFNFLKPFCNKKYDLLLLGCTHLTLIENHLKHYLNYDNIIDTAKVFNFYLKIYL